jgi:hypothetical protein
MATNEGDKPGARATGIGVPHSSDAETRATPLPVASRSGLVIVELRGGFCRMALCICSEPRRIASAMRAGGGRMPIVTIPTQRLEPRGRLGPVGVVVRGLNDEIPGRRRDQQKSIRFRWDDQDGSRFRRRPSPARAVAPAVGVLPPVGGNASPHRRSVRRGWPVLPGGNVVRFAVGRGGRTRAGGRLRSGPRRSRSARPSPRAGFAARSVRHVRFDGFAVALPPGTLCFD